MRVEVLGSGCANCRNTVALIEQVAQSAGIEIDLRKVEDIQQIVGYGVLTTPAVAIDGKVVHAGGIPRREAIKDWLTTAASDVKSPGDGTCCGERPRGGCCG